MVAPRLRFHVLKRDNFRCQYCGKTGDEAILEVDHIIPRSKGGSDRGSNLITSCRECNRGKSNKEVIQTRLKSKTCKCDEYRKEFDEIQLEVDKIDLELDKLYKETRSLESIKENLTDKQSELAIKGLECQINDIQELYDLYTDENIKYEPDYEGHTLDQYKKFKLISVGRYISAIDVYEQTINNKPDNTPNLESKCQSIQK